jgi:prepilin-type N-terminal cleavage/methylation domain-containing protein
MKRSIEHSPRRLQLRRGFSLLELMIVVVLIAGILAIAWPSIARPMRKAELSEATQKLREAIEDGRYQAMMSGEPVFLQITEGDSQLRSGGIDALINGELSEDTNELDSVGASSASSSAVASKSTAPTQAKGLQGLNGSESEAGHGTTGVTPRVWKLPENIVVTSVQWMDQDSDQDDFGSSSFSSGSESTTGSLAGSGDAASGYSSSGSAESGYGGGATGSGEYSDPATNGSHEKWCLPMTAQGRGRDAEITLLDKRARQTLTVSFTAATGELEIVR